MASTMAMAMSMSTVSVLPIRPSWGSCKTGSSCRLPFLRKKKDAPNLRAPFRVQTRISASAISALSDVNLSDIAPTAAAVYGTLLLGGGLFAYANSSSKGSLFGGLTGGSLCALVFALSKSPGLQDLGEAIGFGTALTFAAVFGIRFVATKKVVPAAPYLLLSIATSAIFFGAYLQDRMY